MLHLNTVSDPKNPMPLVFMNFLIVVQGAQTSVTELLPNEVILFPQPWFPSASFASKLVKVRVQSGSNQGKTVPFFSLIRLVLKLINFQYLTYQFKNKRKTSEPHTVPCPIFFMQCTVHGHCFYFKMIDEIHCYNFSFKSEMLMQPLEAFTWTEPCFCTSRHCVLLCSQ